MKRITLACILALLGTLPVAAQDPSEEYWYGFNSYNSFQSSSFDSVNEDSFNLILHIPIVTYVQKGTLPPISITIKYRPPSWYQKEFILPGGGNYYMWEPVAFPIVGAVIGTDPGAGPGTRTFESPGLPEYFESYVLSPDGSIHNMGNTSISGNTYSVAIDASGWLSSSSGLYDKNGIKYTFGILAAISDPAGNSITYSSSGGPGMIDSVGRNIPLAECQTGNPAFCGVGTWTLNYPGLSGGTYPVTYTFASYNIATSFGDPYTNEYSGNATMLQSIGLPNGTKWTLSYNNFGDLSAISTPTGGSVSYAWTNIDVTGGNTYVTDARVLATRAVNANDGSGSRVWTYGTVKPGGANGTAYSGFTDPDGNITAFTTMIRPDPGSLPIATTKQYYQFTASGQAQTLLKTTYTNYSYGYSPFCGGNGNVNDDTGLTNFLPQYTTTTLPNGQGTLVSQVTLIYDSGATFSDPNSAQTIQDWCGPETNSFPLVYGSVLQKQETNYGSGAPGNLLRDTVTVPEWQANSSYLTHGLISRPASVTIYDSTTNTCQGQSNPCAQITYAYDETTNGSVCTTLPCGNLTSEAHWLASSASPKTQYVYNSQGMKAKKCDPIDLSCTNPTQYTYDSSGMFLSEIQYPNTGSTTHTEFFNYDLNTGRLNSHQDQNGQTTSYGYDSMWRLHSISYPDADSETYTYNDTVSYPNSPSFAHTKKITSAINFLQTGIVDGLGRVIQTRTSVPTSTCPGAVAYVDTQYDNEGRKFSVSNPYCTKSDSTYGLTRTYYDTLDRAVLSVPPDGTPPSSGVSCPANDVCTTYAGNCTTVTDQAGAGRKSCGDALGRMTDLWEDPNGANYHTSYTYEVLGNLLSVTQAGSRQRTFAYDALSHLLCAANPEVQIATCPTPDTGSYTAGTIRYAYDANSRVTSKIAPKPNQSSSSASVTTTYQYDPDNRLTQKSFSDSTPTVSYSYDGIAPTNCTVSFSYGSYPKPHRTAMCDAGGNEAWSYDIMGRAAADQRTTNGVTKTFTYAPYNYDGSVPQLAYPSSRTLTYTPNAANGYGIPQQAVSVKDAANNVNYATLASYTPWGALSSVLNSSNIISTWFYNTRLQPCRIAVNSSGTAPNACGDNTQGHGGNVMDYTYSFDLSAMNGVCGTSFASPTDNGNVASVANKITSGRGQNFCYDKLNRLSAAGTVTASGQYCWGELYGYDAWANLLAITPNSSYTGCLQESGLNNITVNASNHILNSGSDTYYDAAGNMTTLPNGLALSFNAEAEMTSANGSSYIYDGDGKRIAKSAAGAIYKIYWYGLNGTPLTESDGSGNTTDEFIFFDGRRIARRLGP